MATNLSTIVKNIFGKFGSSQSPNLISDSGAGGASFNSILAPSGSGSNDPTIASSMVRAWNAYYGHFTKPIQKRPGGPTDYINTNLCRVIVDKGASLLFGDDVKFEPDETQEDEAEQWLESVWENSSKMTLLNKAAVSGGIAGQVYFKISVKPGQKPKIVLLNPSTVNIETAPDDISDILRFTLEYKTQTTAGKPCRFQQITELQDDGNWLITDQIQPEGQKVWTVIDTLIWDYPFPPIVTNQNLPAPFEILGIPDLTPDVIDLNESLNMAFASLAKIIRLHGFPHTYVTGINASQMGQIDWSPDRITPLPENAKMANLEMHSDIANGIKLMQTIKSAIHELSHVPEITTDSTDKLGQLSGLAIKLMFQPLIERTVLKRKLYGEALKELNRRLLILGGFNPTGEVVVHWASPLPEDPGTESETALNWKALGVSKSTILERLGFDAELEARKMQEEAIENAGQSDQLLTAFNQGKTAPQLPEVNPGVNDESDSGKD